MLLALTWVFALSTSIADETASAGTERNRQELPKAAIVDSAPTSAEVEAAVLVSVEHLLERQEDYSGDPPVGSIKGDVAEWQAGEIERLAELRAKSDAPREWPYEGVYRVGPDGFIPSGYRVGGTAIACLALLDAPGLAESGERLAALQRAAEFIVDRIENDEQMAAGPKKGYDVRGWGHAYALRFYLRALALFVFDDDELVSSMRAQVPHLIECIAVNEADGGGWNYARGSVSPFMTGSTLLTLFMAADAGFEVDAELVERALEALGTGRTDAVSYAYSGPAGRAVAMPGSSARSAVAELALHRAGLSTDDDLRTAVLGFFVGWEDLLARKSEQGTHKGEYGIAPYYFYFGHTYAALAIEELPEAERAEHRDELRRLIWRTRDANGGWNDRVFPRTSSYSTAMVALALLAPDLPRVPAWSPAKAKQKR